MNTLEILIIIALIVVNGLASRFTTIDAKNEIIAACSKPV